MSSDPEEVNGYLPLVVYQGDMMSRNVLGGLLKSCSRDPMTGFFRDGCCSTDSRDRGRHVICAEMTADFLEYSRAKGNDLITPRREFSFPGLKPGDKWCLCALRWKEAYEDGIAPLVDLEATEESALEVVELEELLERALQGSAQ